MVLPSRCMSCCKVFIGIIAKKPILFKKKESFCF